MTAISWREGVLLSVIFHLLMVIGLILQPQLFPVDPKRRARARSSWPSGASRTGSTQFVLVEPRVDTDRAGRPNAPTSRTRTAWRGRPKQAPDPTNESPLALGNTPERVEETAELRPRAATGPAPDPAEGEQAQNTPPPNHRPESQSAHADPGAAAAADRDRMAPAGAPPTPGGSLGDALRNLQRYVQMYDNPQGGGGQFGPEIQFDTKGVEFGPWIRRFVAQVKRNWFVPYSVMSQSGHVVIQFNVHKNGMITDLNIVGPCPIEAFNSAAYGALGSSNPDAAASGGVSRPTRRSSP